MSVLGACPVCKTQIDQERVNSGLNICQACGYAQNSREKEITMGLQKTYIKVVTGLSFLMVAGYIHSVNWDNHFAEIIPLKAKQTVGAASAEDLSRIAEICKEREKADCVEEALSDRTANQPGNISFLAQYGKVLSQNNKKERAVAIFSQYFANGGTELEAAYEFAKVLGDTGRYDDAIKYYRFVLDAKPGTLQITVSHNFVDMLVRAGRYELAREVIEGIRKKGENASLFMEDRLQKIRQLTQNG